jgi:hypothetical protein
MPNARLTRGMERPGTETRGATMQLTPAAAPRSEMGRRVEQLVGRYLATDGDRLNFPTNIRVRASHYRLSAGTAMRDRPPACDLDLSMRSDCDSRAHCIGPYGPAVGLRLDAGSATRNRPLPCAL